MESTQDDEPTRKGVKSAKQKAAEAEALGAALLWTHVSSQGPTTGTSMWRSSEPEDTSMIRWWIGQGNRKNSEEGGLEIWAYVISKIDKPKRKVTWKGKKVAGVSGKEVQEIIETLEDSIDIIELET